MFILPPIKSLRYAGHLTTKSDVYSFGVVLLEMLSGKRAVDKNRPSGQHNLVEWAKPYLANKRKIFSVIDSRLEGQYSADESFKVATLALRCLSTESKYRPNMDEVVNILEQLKVPNVNAGNPKRYRRKSADDVSHAKNNSSCASSKSHSAYPRITLSPLYTWNCRYTQSSNLEESNSHCATSVGNRMYISYFSEYIQNQACHNISRGDCKCSAISVECILSCVAPKLHTNELSDTYQCLTRYRHTWLPIFVLVLYWNGVVFPTLFCNSWLSLVLNTIKSWCYILFVMILSCLLSCFS